MKRKSVWVIIISIIAIVGCAAYLLTRPRQSPDNEQAKNSSQKDGLIIKKKKTDTSSNQESSSQSNSQTKSENNYSSEVWMLMGYMAYAHDNYVESRHIRNNADLVKDVGEDLGDSALKAVKTDKDSYHLTNKFGSVDVTVEDDDVKVTGDGSTFTAKSELKETFSSYFSQIKAMSKKISSDN